MAEITKIKAQKNKKRVNIYLDGKFAFPLDADNFLQAGLKVGQELTEKQVEDLIFKNEFQKLLDRVFRLISRRPRSEKEVRDYLMRRNWKLETRISKKSREASNWKLRESRQTAKDKIINGIIKELKKRKLVDDSAFASWWIEQRSTFRPRGKFGLTMELRQKGVDEEIIKKVIDEKVDELPLAKKLAQKKLKAYKNLPREERWQKLSAFLSRRGFSWPVIKQVIDRVRRG